MSRFILRLLVVSLISATAVKPTPAQDFDTQRSNAPSSIETSASLLFLKPGAGNLQYGTLVNPLPVESPHWVNQSIDPDFSPAFNVSLGYHAADSDKDIQLNWTHLDTSDSASVFADPIQFVGPPYEIGPDAGSFRIGNANAQFEYDAVNLDIGKRFNAGGPLQVRVFGGVQLARINEELTASFQTLDATTINGYTNESLFTGAGPRVGVKAQRFGNHFDFLGEIAGGALLGTMESRMDFSAISTAFPTTPNLQSITSPDATCVIPSIDSRFGTGYTFRTKSSKIRAEAGYQMAVYINAINEYAVSDVVVPPVAQEVGVFLRTQTPMQSDFTAHGPYMTLNWEY